MGFSGITPKILTFEYYAKNKTYSEVNFICVFKVKIDREMHVKNPRWPPRNLVFFYIRTSDRGDFPRITVIALFFNVFKNVSSQCVLLNQRVYNKIAYSLEVSSWTA